LHLLAGVGAARPVGDHRAQHAQFAAVVLAGRITLNLPVRGAAAGNFRCRAAVADAVAGLVAVVAKIVQAAFGSAAGLA